MASVTALTAKLISNKAKIAALKAQGVAIKLALATAKEAAKAKKALKK